MPLPFRLICGQAKAEPGNNRVDEAIPNFDALQRLVVDQTSLRSMRFVFAGGDSLARGEEGSWSRASVDRFVSPLPNAAGVFVDHERALLAAEGLLEFWHVGNRVVDAIPGERVRVGKD
jgi:hypothetical protein